MDANAKACIRRLIADMKSVLKQEAHGAGPLIAQANIDLEEQGWLFAVRILPEGWPQGMEEYIELGKQLLAAIAARAGKVKSTTLTICAHDPCQAGKAEPSKAIWKEALCTNKVPGLTFKMATGSLMMEGCVRTKEPHLKAHHIEMGIEEAMGGMLQTIGRDPEALTTAGHSTFKDQAVSSRVLTVRVPQLWEDLVQFGFGKEVSFSISEGGQVQARLPALGR